MSDWLILIIYNNEIYSYGNNINGIWLSSLVDESMSIDYNIGGYET